MRALAAQRLMSQPVCLNSPRGFRMIRMLLLRLRLRLRLRVCLAREGPLGAPGYWGMNRSVCESFLWVCGAWAFVVGARWSGLVLRLAFFFFLGVVTEQTNTID
jgi:hypothetical protein